MTTAATILRRASGRPTYVPPLAGPLAWYDASTESYANGAAVSPATDRSGNARDAIQATAGSRPTFVTAAINGLPVYRFDGVNDMLQTAAFVLVQPLNIFVVGKAINGAGQYFCDGRSGNTLGVLKQNTNTMQMYGGALLVGAALDASNHILQATFNGASSVARVGGGAGTTGDAGAFAVSGFTLGAYGGALAFLSGDIAEVLLYGALSLANTNVIGNYLATKYGLSWTTAT